MSLAPQKFREIVFQLLYSSDFEGGFEEEMIPFMMHELKVTKRIMLDAAARKTSVQAHYAEIDEKIRTASTEYTFERISRVEKTVLRLGLFELLFDESLPQKVAIAEAIRLCRKFGSPEGAQFVNAILDSVYKAKHGLAISAQTSVE
jgi:transcription antitermination protein NusB